MTLTAGGALPLELSVRVASAGTGKTTSLVVRYLELIGRGEPLRRVAGVTFTRAAAGELRQRVAEGVMAVLQDGHYLGGLYRPPSGAQPQFEIAANELEGALLTTIHGFMAAALRLNAPQLGIDPAFGRLGEWEAEALFETELRSLLLVAKDPTHPLHASALHLGSEAEELALGLFRKRSLAERFEFGASPTEAALRRVYLAATQAFHAALGGRALGPPEVEARAVALLGVTEATQRLVARYPRVLIDEYQDVNPLQGRFFAKLAEAGARLEVVGDPKQSIYGFRNADISVFREALAAARTRGTALEPLSESRRHSRNVLAFLNALTARFAGPDGSFAPEEATAVEPAGAQANVKGAVELHVVQGTEPLAELRSHEAAILAERLKEHRAAGIPYEEMAVLARSYTGLKRAEAALTARGVPCSLYQGRGYYERPEIRDVHHALAVGVDASGASLAPFLRGPLAALEPAELTEIMSGGAGEPLSVIGERFGGVMERIEWLRGVAREHPAAALRRLLRERPPGAQRLSAYYGPRERENLDALLFEVADNPPANISLLLERLQHSIKRRDAGDVPQLGSGVKLMTIHASKGLEFALVALFDAGGRPSTAVDDLLVDPSSSRVHVRGMPGFELAAAQARQRSRAELDRLLYVACSRARDALVLTGSSRANFSGGHNAWGWLKDLSALKVWRPTGGVRMVKHAFEPQPLAAVAAPTAAPLALEAAPYLEERLPASPFPPVISPTRLAAALEARREAAPAPEFKQGEREGEASFVWEGMSEELHGDEPLPAAILASAEREVERGQVGWGRARGTLVHYAISQNWRPNDERTRATLLAQEVLFPYGEGDRAALVTEVEELLAAYWNLIGGELPPLKERSVDRAELPLAVRRGRFVWEGVVDRLYRVEGDWFVDDYKTDATVKPERYYLQLGLYLEALKGVLGAEPRARLVFLRAGRVVSPAVTHLSAALEEALAGEFGELLAAGRAQLPQRGP